MFREIDFQLKHNCLKCHISCCDRHISWPHCTHGQHITDTLAHRCDLLAFRCTSKGEEDYRPLFENFVYDLLSTVNKPDWPAAELILSLLGNLLVIMTFHFVLVAAHLLIADCRDISRFYECHMDNNNTRELQKIQNSPLQLDIL